MNTRRPLTYVGNVITPVRFYWTTVRVRPWLETSRLEWHEPPVRRAPLPGSEAWTDSRRFSVIMQKITPLDIEMVEIDV